MYDVYIAAAQLVYGLGAYAWTLLVTATIALVRLGSYIATAVNLVLYSDTDTDR